MEIKERIALLKSTRIFAGLNDKEYEDIISYFELIELNKDEILFKQGDISDSIYILIDGLLAAALLTAKNEIKTVGRIEKGEVVGELGALSNEPRSLTVQAASDAKLLKLSADDFIRISKQYSSILYNIILSQLISRSQKTLRILSLKKECEHILIISANDTIPFKEFKEKLTTETLLKNIPLFTDEDLNNTNAVKLQEKIHELEKVHSTILYIVESLNESLNKSLLNYFFDGIDILFVVGEGKSPPAYSQNTAKLVDHFVDEKLKLELILIQGDKIHLPHHTDLWLKSQTYAAHYHVRLHNTPDYQRLLRFLTGTAIGLVLGGGGTKGWAHVGVIKALEEKKIPIDIIGGTSIGSMVGACYAKCESYKGILAQFNEIMLYSDRTLHIRNLTWPGVSISSSKENTESLIRVFHSIHIEDLWRPFFCLSSNFTLRKEAIHFTGLLWEKLRASASIPGLIPPMVIDKQLHFDGGLINNLPVGIMRKILGLSGKIIAVSISAHGEDPHQYHFPPVMSFIPSFLTKMGWGKYKQYKFPPFIDTFLESLLLGSSSNEIRSGLEADLLIKPDLISYTMFGIKKSQAEKIIEIGYQAALKNIEQSKHLL